MKKNNKKILLIKENNKAVPLKLKKDFFKNLFQKLPILIVVVGLVLILWGVFDIYNQEKPDAMLKVEKTQNTGSVQTDINEKGDILEEGVSTSVIPTPAISENENEVTQNTDNTPNPLTENIADNIELNGWVANDYKYNEITTSSYEVKYGDTLWEIAEGFYGNGSMWTDILRFNSNSVGFLPNGQQALIFPGQILILSK